MKIAAGLVLGCLLTASIATSTTYYALEVRGGSRIYALDMPVRKGRVYVFHRFPDGVYMSLSSTEVEKVASQTEAPASKGGLQPGQSVYVGGTVPWTGVTAPAAAPPAPAPYDALGIDSGYGYGYSDYGWGGGYTPPPRPGPVPPSRIGPNGFPILAPPGSPGSTPPPIGANGFPILAPQPAPSPRRP
jgi:hypothetical protein